MDMGNDERKIDSMTVRTNLLFFWLKTRLTLTNRRQPLVPVSPRGLRREEVDGPRLRKPPIRRRM